MIPNIMRQKALEFCVRNIHDWVSLVEETKSWYVCIVSTLLDYEDDDLIIYLLQAQLN